ncbi:hypothetical protein BC834DRAFT_536837 [Gloeopeniophorella convolvens]|nr:hypothetical protein BC834DRAFT_536837 [Gloeopeniophorella convolvens]
MREALRAVLARTRNAAQRAPRRRLRHDSMPSRPVLPTDADLCDDGQHRLEHHGAWGGRYTADLMRMEILPWQRVGVSDRLCFLSKHSAPLNCRHSLRRHAVDKITHHCDSEEDAFSHQPSLNIIDPPRPSRLNARFDDAALKWAGDRRHHRLRFRHGETARGGGEGAGGHGNGAKAAASGDW